MITSRGCGTRSIFRKIAGSPRPVRQILRELPHARRLAEAGVSVITLKVGDWDTHEKNFIDHKDQLPQLDRGLHALVTDLPIRGWTRTWRWWCGASSGGRRRSPAAMAGPLAGSRRGGRGRRRVPGSGSDRPDGPARRRRQGQGVHAATVLSCMFAIWGLTRRRRSRTTRTGRCPCSMTERSMSYSPSKPTDDRPWLSGSHGAAHAHHLRFGTGFRVALGNKRPRRADDDRSRRLGGLSTNYHRGPTMAVRCSGSGEAWSTPHVHSHGGSLI